MTDQYLKNIEDCYFIFKIVGIFRPKNVHIVHLIYGFILRFFFIDIFLVLQTLYFSRVKNIIDFADLLSMQLTWISIASKSYIVIWQFEKVARVVENLREVLNFASSDQKSFGFFISKRMKSIRKVFIIYWITCPFTVVLGAIAAVLIANEPPYQLHYKLYPLWFFNYEQNYIIFLIFEIFEVIGPVIAATTAVAMDFLGVFFFSAGAGLLEELAKRIDHIAMNKQSDFNKKKKNLMSRNKEERFDEENMYFELRKCIEIHAKIKLFLSEAQDLCSPIIFIQVVISTAVICMTCYTISMVSH